MIFFVLHIKGISLGTDLSTPCSGILCLTTYKRYIVRDRSLNAMQRYLCLTTYKRYTVRDRSLNAMQRYLIFASNKRYIVRDRSLNAMLQFGIQYSPPIVSCSCESPAIAVKRKVLKRSHLPLITEYCNKSAVK